MTGGECLLVKCERVTGFPWLGLFVAVVAGVGLWLAWKWDRDYDRKDNK